MIFRLNGLLEEEREARLQCETRERECRRELSEVREAAQHWESEAMRLQEEGSSHAQALQRELQRLQEVHTQQMSVLEHEAREATGRAQTEVLRRSQALQTQLEEAVERVRGDELETVRQQAAGERTQALLEMQARCDREVAEVRAEERRLAAVEIDKVTIVYLIDIVTS